MNLWWTVFLIFYLIDLMIDNSFKSHDTTKEKNGFDLTVQLARYVGILVSLPYLIIHLIRLIKGM